MSLVKVGVLPMSINESFTESSSIDVSPHTAATTDSVFRPSSLDIFVATQAPQTFQIYLYNDSEVVLVTEPVIVSMTTKRFRLRAPKNLQYRPRDGSFWRLITSGPGRIGGTATFTVRETLNAG
jgi:hypothetical protein